MIRTSLIATSSIIALISPIVYAKGILKGEAKPHRTTRLVLLIITSLATISLFAQHDRVAIWLAGVSTLQSIAIFILSIKHGMGGWSKIDVLCLLIAITGIILWQTTNNPSLALYSSIIADFTGMIPTLIKTYKQPETEVWIFFGLDVIAGFLSLLALENWNVQDFAFPLYIIVINLIMFIFCKRKHL